jgi:hypothetical protein
MNQNIFLNWENDDPKVVYPRHLKEHPLYWNDDQQIWMAYSYSGCKTILSSECVRIPGLVIENNSLLNDKARLLVKKLARLSNDDQHMQSREAAMMIYQNIQQVSIDDLLDGLINGVKDTSSFDWISVVCKKLPALVILKGLDLVDADCEIALTHISSLVKILSADKSASDIEAINNAVDEFYRLSEKYITSAQFITYIRQTSRQEQT